MAPCCAASTSLRGLVRPGNSGGPLVDAAGRWPATVFAAITGGPVSPEETGFAVPNAIVRKQLAIAKSRNRSVGTGPCAG